MSPCGICSPTIELGAGWWYYRFQFGHGTPLYLSICVSICIHAHAGPHNTVTSHERHGVSNHRWLKSLSERNQPVTDCSISGAFHGTGIHSDSFCLLIPLARPSPKFSSPRARRFHVCNERLTIVCIFESNIMERRIWTSKTFLCNFVFITKKQLFF